MTTMTLHRDFAELSARDMRDIEGGNLFLAVAAGGITMGGVLLGVAALGYTIGKDLAERQNDECECPEESKK